MKQDPSPRPKPPKDRMDSVAREQTDWPVEKVKQLALELYVRFPFDEDDTERWKDLAREAFWVFDNLDEACKEVLRERSEDRRASARLTEAHRKLPALVPFDKAARYITGEKRTDRATPKFIMFLSYEARVIPFEGVSPKLSAEQRRQLRAQLEKWRNKGIIREQAMQMQSRFERYWPVVRADLNSANRMKQKRRPRLPHDPDARKIIRAVLREKNELT